MAIIKHPRPAAGRQRFIGIVFRDGYADFDLTARPHMRDSLIQHGYTIEELPEPEKTLTKAEKKVAEREALQASFDAVDEHRNNMEAAELAFGNVALQTRDADPSGHGDDSTPLDPID